MIDEYSDVRAAAAAWKPATNPHASRLFALEKEIARLADLQPPDAEVLLTGFHFSVPVGMKRIRRTIVNVSKLFARLGNDWVLKHCAPSLGDVDKVLEPAERSQYIAEERILSRIIGEPVQAQAKRRAA
jgi:hypothetical protein